MDWSLIFHIAIGVFFGLLGIAILVIWILFWMDDISTKQNKLYQEAHAEFREKLRKDRWERRADPLGRNKAPQKESSE